MFIKNITDKNTPKVVGVGHVWLQPGEEKFFPNDGLYISEVDKYGKKTGKKVVLPAIMNQVRLNMIEIKEDVKSEKEIPTKVETVVAKGETVPEEIQEKVVEIPKKTRRTKKETN